MFQYFKRIGIALSVLFNVFWGGYSGQTTSARNYAWKRQGKPNAVWLIDPLAVCVGKFVRRDLSNHCMESWIYWRVRKDVIYDIQREIIIEENEYNGKRWKIERFRFIRGAFKHFNEDKKIGEE